MPAEPITVMDGAIPSKPGLQAVPDVPDGATSARTAPRVATLADRLAELADTRRRLLAGDDGLTARQHRQGKLTVRERLAALLDPGSFTELQPFRAPADAQECEVVAGTGAVRGRRVSVYATDFRVRGGSLGPVGASKIRALLDMASSLRVPVIALHDGAGARIQEGISSLDGYGEIFRRTVALSGVVPQISVILGPCAGGAVYTPALTDFVFMVSGIGSMYVTGPDVVQAVTGEALSIEQLGGASVHGTSSGVATNVYADEQSCLDDVRYLLSFLPDNCDRGSQAYDSDDPVDRSCPELREIVPESGSVAYDVVDVISCIADHGDLFEIAGDYARNLVCAFVRIGGVNVGVVANQPSVLAGALDSAASEKGARFVRFCDAFDIPLVTLVDVPGFMPGRTEEASGLIRRGAKLLYAYCEASVPRISVVLRKAYGGAYIVMDSRSVGTDVALAWPMNEVAVMGAEAAARVVHRRRVTASREPAALLDELASEYAKAHLHPLNGARQGFIDNVIDPASTRAAIAAQLQMLAVKRATQPVRKHSTMPL